MYLIDTNVISEARKKHHANSGVRKFFKKAVTDSVPLYISVVTIGELRRGIELLRHRGDLSQATQLDKWLTTIVESYREHILDFSEAEAQVWGTLRVPNPEHALDKQIAATALTYGLTVVTRNIEDFAGSRIEVYNPFTQ